MIVTHPHRPRGLALCSFVFFCVLLLLYFSPPAAKLRALPDAVAVSSDAYAALDNTVAVAKSGDERLQARLGETTLTLKLFSVLPLRSVTVVTNSRSVTAGGIALGVVLHTRGVQLVGLSSVNTANGRRSPASAAGLKAGDLILSVNGTGIESAAQFASLVTGSQGVLALTCERDGNSFSCKLDPAVDTDSGLRRIGAWVRDSSTGVGTLSFYDASSGRYAALGHPVTDVDTGAILATRDGFVGLATILDVIKGQSGVPGELLGSFSSDKSSAIGDVTVNGEYGIAGTLDTAALGSTGTIVPLARAAEVYKGEATILCTVDDGGVESYRCEVIRTEVQSAPAIQGMVIRVTDPELLKRTGGVVQGMSGSPVLQDGRLIGVVTHVFVNDPTRGFCLYAEWMAQELLPTG